MKSYVRYDDENNALEVLRGNRAPAPKCLLNTTGVEEISCLEVYDHMHSEPVLDEDGEETGEVYEWAEKRVRVNQAAKEAYDQAKADEEAAAAASAYKQLRAAEYPSIGDQLDAIYKKHHLNDDTEYNLVCGDIQAVKEKYPKPE